MTKVSRRALARYAADQLLAGKPAKSVARHLAAAMLEAGKPSDINFLLGDIAAELENRRELTIATTTSATALTPQLRTALKKKVQKASQSKNVLLEENIDSSVLGGVRIETPSRIWDSTVARKLADLKEAF